MSTFLRCQFFSVFLVLLAFSSFYLSTTEVTTVQLCTCDTAALWLNTYTYRAGFGVRVTTEDSWALYIRWGSGFACGNGIYPGGGMSVDSFRQYRSWNS